jgi:hypothetical protein
MNKTNQREATWTSIGRVVGSDTSDTFICADQQHAKFAAKLHNQEVERLTAQRDQLLGAAITTGHDIAEIRLWLSCPESKSEAKLKSIAAILDAHNKQRCAAIASAEGK